MDENKVIRVILEARDDSLTGVLKKAQKETDQVLVDMDKSFLKSRKGVNLYEYDFEKMADSIADDSKKIDKATISIKGMTQALKDAVVQSRKVRAAANQSFPGFGGTTIRRGAGGRFEAVKQQDSLNASLKRGYNIAKDTQKQLDIQLGSTKEIRKENLAILDAKLRNNILKSSTRQDAERAEQAEKVEEKVRQSGLLEIREEALVKLHKANQKFEKTQTEEDLRAAQKLQNEYEFIGKRIAQITGVVSNERTRRFQEERKEIRRAYNEDKANIKNLGKERAAEIIEEFKVRRKEQLNSGTRRERIGKQAGFALGDFFGGIGRGRSEVRDLDKDLEKLSSTFGRIGFAIGGAFRNLNNLVNLRWLFLTSAITLLINVITQLVVVLVSVASSAALAASALGAAFVAGVTQAIPVVALLAGAFHSFQNVLKAVQLENKADVKGSNDAKEAADKRAQAIQRLSDAHYTVKKAIQSVKDANYDLTQSHYRVGQAEQERIQAIKDLADARKQASRDIVDANQQEKDSALALEEAELALLEAREKLRKEQEKGKNKNFDIAQAQAAVKEANDRLKLAKAQGDNSEIIKASQQLSIVEQNLSAAQDAASTSNNDLQDAQLAVKRAELNREQASTRKKRDAQDAARLRKEGIEQSKRVLDAEKQLVSATKAVADAQHDVAQSQLQIADSVHALAIARREEVDAKKALADKTNLQSTAQKNLNEAVAQFSPAEKKLYKALLRVKNAYKKAFSGTPGKDGILSPIINGFSSIADAVTALLTDPKILKALGGLAKSIGDGIQRFAKLLTSKSFKSDLLFFIDQATQNLPKVVDIFLQIFNIIRKIGKEGAPIFSELVGGIDSLLGRANKAAGQKVGGTVAGGRPEEGTRGANAPAQQTRLGKFLEGAGTHLDSWLKLGKAIARVLYLLTNVAAPTGKSLIESATDALNNLGDYIKDNPEAVKKFFNDIAESFKQLAAALLNLTKLFGKAAQDPDIQNFAIFLVEVIVPGIYLMIKGVGLLVGALTTLTNIPILGKFIKLGLEILVAEKALNKLFPITQGVTNLLRKGLAKSLEGFAYFIKNPKNALIAAKVQMQLLGNAAVTTSKKVAENAKKMGQAWIDFGKTIGESVKKGARTAATGLGNLSTKLLDVVKNSRIVAGLSAAFSILVNGIKAVGLALKAVFFTPPFILLLIAAIITAIVLLDRKFHFIRPTIEFFEKQFKRVFAWIKDHWKLLAAIIAAPFLLAALPFITIFKFRNKIFKVLSDIKNGFVNTFEAIKNAIVGSVKFITKQIEKIWDKIPGPVKTLLKIATNPVGAAKQFGGKAYKAGKKILGFAGGSSGIPGVGRSDTVPAMLTPGEWVLNSGQIRRVASLMGVSVQQAKAYIFGTNIPNSKGNPGVLGTAGKPGKTGLRPSKRHSPIISGSYSLIPQEDDSGITVWFIQMADGTFGQVTGRDAAKIQNSNGRFIPGYVKRNSHGFNQRIQTEMNPLRFANGGIVPRAIRGFAEGGVVQSPGFGSTTPNGTQVHQNFNVKTEGATDWAYVMRVSAVTAQSAF
jgi:phage-related protein